MAIANDISAKAVPEKKCCLRICPKFSYGVMLLGVLTLAFTGIGTFAFGKPPMTGWVVMLHVGASPLFSIGLALVALSWPGRCCEQSCASKALLWLVLLCGLLVILSGVVPMTPLFGTEGQHTLYLTHRYSAIVLTVLVVLHLLSLRRVKR
jgi:hypothetical protein